ncbi:MAG: TetR/AcrR family transcriptional regulator [Solirubrobacteraceae bacterium]|nr:TetR/AcrR family transcriptional regulator [Solirubrobacteraceae bacterium]
MSQTRTSHRDRLLQALANVIAREGYANTRVADVAREARVSLRTFYEEFDSKESGFLALHAMLTDAVASSLEDSANFDQPWRAAIREGFDTYFRLLVAQPKLTTAIMIELTTLSPEAYEAREYARERFTTVMSNLVERGREANPEIPSRPLTPLMARCILGGLLELVTTEVVDEGVDHLPEFVDTCTDLLWSVVTTVE